MPRAVPRDPKYISRARAGARRKERKPKPLQARVVGQLSRKSLGMSHKKPYANRPGSALVPHLQNPIQSARCPTEFVPALTLQLFFCFEVRALSGSLVSSTPE